MALIALTTAPSQSVQVSRRHDQRIGGVGGSRKPLRERRRSCAWMRPERRDGVLHKAARERGVSWRSIGVHRRASLPRRHDPAPSHLASFELLAFESVRCTKAKRACPLMCLDSGTGGWSRVGLRPYAALNRHYKDSRCWRERGNAAMFYKGWFTFYIRRPTTHPGGGHRTPHARGPRPRLTRLTRT